jgi:hypothetical protein
MYDSTISMLKKQQQNFQSLLRITKEKQEALTANDNNLLTAVIGKEEKVLTAIQILEKDRIANLQILADDILPNRRNGSGLPKLHIMLKGRISEDELAAVQETEVSMHRIAAEIKMVNERNLFLIQLQRKLINDTINALIKDRRKAYIDKKV